MNEAQEAQVINESIAYLRERFEDQLSFDDITPWSHVMVAAEDRADLLESDAIVIKRDSEGNWPTDQSDLALQAAMRQFIHINWANDPGYSIHDLGDQLQRLRLLSDFQQAVSIVHAFLDALADSSKAPEPESGMRITRITKEQYDEAVALSNIVVERPIWMDPNGGEWDDSSKAPE